jgi:hypothetical protein
MLGKLSARGCGLLVAVAILIPLVVGWFWLAGSAVVVDETGGVTSAVVTDDSGTEQPLHRLWNGYFYAIPKMEGTIEVRCRNGARKQAGYVTGHVHTKIRVVGHKPCEQFIET